MEKEAEVAAAEKNDVEAAVEEEKEAVAGGSSGEGEGG